VSEDLLLGDMNIGGCKRREEGRVEGIEEGRESVGKGEVYGYRGRNVS
jgi:hypothetical protein